MALAPLDDMTHSEITEYVEKLEAEVQTLRAKTDNRKKLSTREVEMILRLWGDGRTQAEIADIFQVNPATISRTVRGIYH